MNVALCLLAMLAALPDAKAPPAQARMMAWRPGADRETDKPLGPLYADRVDVEVTARGPLVEVQTTVTYANTCGREVEGDLTFPLPRGATVTGYALDVQGEMVDGVAVEKAHATRAFEAETARRIDPGLVEHVRDNWFRTRVFPIPVDGKRTIRIRYSLEVPPTARPHVSIPLGWPNPVKECSIRVRVLGTSRPPRVVRSPVPGLRFVATGQDAIARAQARDTPMSPRLVLELPDAREPMVLVEAADDGQCTFAICAYPPRVDACRAKQADRVTIYWDASASAGQAPHDKELAAVERLLKHFGAAAVDVDLIAFHYKAEPARRLVVRDGDTKALRRALARMDYDGGTSLGCLPPPREGTDLAILVTDGRGTLGSDPPRNPGVPTVVLSQSPWADHEGLRYLAESQAGRYIPLATTDAMQAHLAFPPAYRVAEIRVEGQVADLLPAPGPHMGAGRLLIVGRLLGGSAKVTIDAVTDAATGARASRAFGVSRARAQRGRLVRSCWAGRRLRTLLPGGAPSRSAVLALARRHTLVTPYTSLIVLESLDQYKRYGIRPPACLPQMRKRWDQTMAYRLGSARRRPQAAVIPNGFYATWVEHLRATGNHVASVGKTPPRTTSGPRRPITRDELRRAREERRRRDSNWFEDDGLFEGDGREERLRDERVGPVVRRPASRTEVAEARSRRGSGGFFDDSGAGSGGGFFDDDSAGAAAPARRIRPAAGAGIRVGRSRSGARGSNSGFFDSDGDDAKPAPASRRPARPPDDVIRVPNFKGPRIELSGAAKPPNDQPRGEPASPPATPVAAPAEPLRPRPATQPAFAGKPVMVTPGLLAPLAKAPPANRAGVYRRLRAKYGASGEFYVDAADLFAARGDKARAVRVLTGVADLPAANVAAAFGAALRLEELGEVDKAVELLGATVARRREDDTSQSRPGTLHTAGVDEFGTEAMLRLELGRMLGRRAAGYLAGAAKAAETGRPDTARRLRQRALAGYTAAAEQFRRVIAAALDRTSGRPTATSLALQAMTELSSLVSLGRTAGLTPELAGVDMVQFRMPTWDMRVVVTCDQPAPVVDVYALPEGKALPWALADADLPETISLPDVPPDRWAGRRELILRRVPMPVLQLHLRSWGIVPVDEQPTRRAWVDVYTGFGRPTQRHVRYSVRLTPGWKETKLHDIRF